MKKLIALLLVTLVMVSFASAETLSGGWSASQDPAVTEELKALFEKGTETLTGASYIPVAYLGSQVVAGRNHAFLCQSVTAYPGSLETAPAYAMVYLYEDLSGNVSILSIADFDIGALSPTEWFLLRNRAVTARFFLLPGLPGKISVFFRLHCHPVRLMRIQ